MKCLVGNHFACYAAFVYNRIVYLCARDAKLLKEGEVKVRIPVKRVYCEECGKEMSLADWNSQTRIILCDNGKCRARNAPVGGELIEGDNLVIDAAKKRLEKRLGYEIDEEDKQALSMSTVMSNLKRRR